MKVTIEYDINDCNDYIFRRSDHNTGATFNYCGHKLSPNGYGSMLYSNSNRQLILPKWCPLGINSIENN